MRSPTEKTIQDGSTPDAPMRPEQARRLQILCAELMEAYDESLTETPAAERIAELERIKQERKDQP
jgi:hypothetical protein